MTPIDWIIILVLVLSVLQGLRLGLIVSLISLAGWIAAIFVAARYWYIAMPLVRHFCSAIWLRQLVSYFLVALLTVVVFTLVARLLRKTLHGIGFAGLDRLLGGVFGLLRGLWLVVLGFIIVAAMAPQILPASKSRLAPYFLSASQALLRGAPSAAANEVLSGLQQGPREDPR